MGKILTDPMSVFNDFIQRSIYVGYPGFKKKFNAHFKLTKKEVNPFNFELPMDIAKERELLDSIDFKADNEPYLRKTKLTGLQEHHKYIFTFDPEKSIFENLSTPFHRSFECRNLFHIHSAL